MNGQGQIVDKKIFSLIYGEQITTSPRQKIIPASSVSTLIEAQEILDKIKKDAIEYRLNVTKECEQIKEEAYQKGFEEGLNQLTSQLVHLEEVSAHHKEELQKMVIPLALKIAKKIVIKEIELSRETIVEMIAAHLKTVAQHKKIVLSVNPEDLEVVETHKPRLRAIFEKLETFSIMPRKDIAKGGFIIQTDIGIVDGQLEARWHVLEKFFEKLNATKLASQGEIHL